MASIYILGVYRARDNSIGKNRLFRMKVFLVLKKQKVSQNDMDHK